MQVQLATRVDKQVKTALEALSAKLGIKIGRLIEDAILDKLEEYLDTKEIQKLKKEPTRRFEDVIEDLKAHGKI